MAKKDARRGSRRTATARFDMPFVVPNPLLANAAAGIDRPRLRGSRYSYRTDVTVLDTPDHRLLRSGVLLAHRTSDGLSDWYLNAHDWTPLMPEELSVPASRDAGDAEVSGEVSADRVPAELAHLVRPFQRLATLEPVAVVTLERSTYAIRSTPTEGGLVVATLRDDRFTIRRAGVAIGRVREVTLRPMSVISSEQRAHLVKSLVAAGGTQVEEFPDLRGRLGAPATGLTDFPEPRPWREDMPLEEFVAKVFAARLRAIMAADLELRTGATDSTSHLTNELRGLATDVRGLAEVLDPQWRQRLDDDLEVLVGEGSGDAAPIQEHGDRYLGLLDLLVGAARSPRLGDHRTGGARTEMLQLLESQLTVLGDRCATLDRDAPDTVWAAALASARQARSTASAASEMLGKPGRRLFTDLDQLVSRLEPAAHLPAEPGDNELSGMPARAVLDLGRRLEREETHARAQRDAVIEAWPKVSRHLHRVLGE